MTTPSRTAPRLPKAGPTDAEIESIIRRSQGGDETLTAEEVRGLLDAVPALARANGSPARHLTDSLLGWYAKNPVIQESVRRKLVEVRRELEGPNPTPLERLLAERAAICWLTVNQYENAFAQASRLAFRDAEHQQRRIDAAHRRFLSAIRTLAAIRKLALPAIQVNIAESQVNVANSS